MTIIQIKIDCAMCMTSTNYVTCDIVDGKIDLKKCIERTGWITQQNGESFDIYCSKRCAS